MKIKPILLIVLVLIILSSCTNVSIPVPITPTLINLDEIDDIQKTGTAGQEAIRNAVTNTPVPLPTEIPGQITVERTPTLIRSTEKPQTPIPTAKPTMEQQILAEKLASQQYWPYIGLVVPPMPDGFDDPGGQYPVFPEFDYAIRIVHQGAIKMLWFEKFIIKDRQWFGEVVDILVLPTLSEGEAIIPTGCSNNGVPDDEIFVLAHLTGRALNDRYVYPEDIRQAWRANRTAERWEIIAATGIECHADDAFRFESSP